MITIMQLRFLMIFTVNMNIYLYGIESMTFNLHIHSHFLRQVLNNGPLNKTSAMCFENKFKHTRDQFHGTVNYEGQIARNLERKQQIIIELKQLKD